MSTINCSGVSGGCGADAKKPDYTECGTNADDGLCRLNDHCIAGAFASTTLHQLIHSFFRAAANVCDQEEKMLWKRPHHNVQPIN